MSQMLKSSGAMAGATMTSRLLGMVREMAYAWFMGGGWVAGAFQVAFAIPNLFRRLLGEGALTAAFIPLFKEKERTAGEAEMWRAANAVISGLLAAAAALILLVLLGLSATLALHQFEPRVELMLRLLRWMFPYMLLVCLAAVFMGMLNARGHFFVPAMGATMLNVVMIGSVFLLAPRWGTGLPQQIFALAVGVLVAGLAQTAFQLPWLGQEGFRYHWVSPWRNETVREVLRRMVPGAIGVAAFQINVVVVQNLGLVLGSANEPIIAPFNYSVRLMELPQGVFGISLATYLLPTLAGLAAEKNYPEFRANLRQAAGHLLLVNLLAAALLVVLAEPIIRLIYQRGKFGPADTLETAFALQCLGASLVGYSLVNIFARAFYALGDTRTPMKISIVCLAVNLAFALILVFPLRQGGFGLANTASSSLNCGLLLFALRKKLKILELAPLRASLAPMAGATLAASAVAWISLRFWSRHFGHAHLGFKIAEVFVPATAAALVYGAITLALKVPSAWEMLDLVVGRIGRSRTGGG